MNNLFQLTYASLSTMNNSLPSIVCNKKKLNNEMFTVKRLSRKGRFHCKMFKIQGSTRDMALV